MASYELIDETNGKSYRHLGWRILLLVCLCVVSTFLVYRLWEYVYSPYYGDVLALKYPGDSQTLPVSVHRATLYSLAFQNLSTESHDFRLVKNTTFRVKYMHSNTNLNNLVPESSSALIVCYYCAPESSGKYVDLNLTEIDGSLCTHINVGMSYILHNSSISISERLEKVLLYDVPLLRQKYPSLRIMLWIGGGDAASGGFSDMVKTHQSRKLFLQSLKSTLSTYKLDGCDLDWEFPSAYNRERMHFSQLLYEIRQEYRREKKPYLLSLAVAAPEGIALFSYDVGEINKYADHVNIMTYDYHFYTKGTPFTGINAPLYARDNEHSILGTLNINYSVHWWITNGLDPKKIIVGLPTYGHSFSLISPFNTKIGAPTNGYGHTGNQGFVSAGEVCWFLQNNILSSLNFDKNACSPYGSSGTEWISFENALSITCKTKYIKQLGLGGAMIFSLNTDDFNGFCSSNKKFPLLQIVHNVLKNKAKAS